MAKEDLTVSLGLSTGNAEKSITELKKEIKFLTQEFKTAGKGIDKFEDTLEGQQAKMKMLEGSYKAQNGLLEQYKKKMADTASAIEKKKAELTKLNSAEEKNEKAIEKVQRQLVQYENTMKQTQRSISLTENELKYLEREMSKVNQEAKSNDIDTLAKDMKEASEEAEELGSNLSGIADGIGNAFVGVAASISGMAATIGGFAFKSVLDLDKAMSQLKASTGATNEQMDEFEQVAKNIYNNNFGDSWDDVADAMAQVNKQLWLTGDELQSVTEKAFTIRDTFGADVQESVRATKTLMKQFGVSGEEAMNLITQGYQNNLDFSGEFLDSINEYSVHFAQMGLDAEDMFRIFYDGSESGAFNLDKVGDAIKELGIRTKDMSDGTRQAFKDLGLDVSKTEKAFAKGGEEGAKAFDEVITALEKVKDPLKRNEIGVALMGTMYEDLGETAVFALNDMSDNFNKTVDSAEELANVKYDNISDAFAGIKRNIEVGALIPIGEKLLPLVQEFADWLNAEGIPKIVEFAESFGNKLAGAIESIMPYMDDIAGVLGYLLDNITWIVPLLVGLGGAFKALSFIGTITPLITAVSGAIASAGGVVAVLSGALTFLTGPIGLVIGGVALLAFAFATNFGGIRDTVFEVIGAVKDFLIDAWDTIYKNNKNTIDAMKKFVEVIFKSIGDIINGALDFIKGIFQAFSKILKGDWKGAWESVKETTSNLLGTIAKIIGNLLDAIVDVIISIGVDIANSMYKSWLKAKEGAEKAWKSLCDWFKKAIKDPIGTIKGIGSSLYSAGKSMIQSVWDGCKSIWTSVSNWFSEKVNWIKDKLFFWNNSKSQMRTSDIPTGRNAQAPYNADIPTTFVMPMSEDIALSGSYYQPTTFSSRELANTGAFNGGNKSTTGAEDLLKQLLNVTMHQQQLQPAGINLTIQNFNNYDTETDIRKLAKQLNEYYEQYRL